MNYRILIILLLLFVGLPSIYASITISGLVKSKNDEIVPFANIVLKHQGKLVTGTTTDDTGRFQLVACCSGRYELTISHILYTTKIIDLDLNNNDLDLDTINIVENNKIIDDINIIAQDVIHKSDRDIVILNDKYTKQTVNTEQVLQRLPSVSMDIVSRTFKVSNRKNVLLQVDGVNKNEQYIRSIPPSNIIKVEIIRDVSGRFANEYDAILNVITNKSLRGYSLSGEDYTIATLADEENDVLINNISLNYSYYSAKSNIYGGYTNNYSRFKIDNETEYIYDDGFKILQNTPAKKNLYSSSENSVFVGADFNLAPDKVLSAELRYSFSPFKTNKQESEQEFSKYTNSTLLDQYVQNNVTQAKNDNPYALIAYEGNIGTKNRISTGISYYINRNEYYNHREVDNNIRREDGVDNKEYLDMYMEDNLSINNKVNLDINYSYRYQDVETSYRVNNIESPIYTNSLIRHNAGIYLNYSINDYSDLKVGSAVENITLSAETGENIDINNQLVALPLLSYNSQITKKLSARINYKVNTYNPSMMERTPYTFVIDSFTTIKGNPLLKPSYYHEIKGAIDFAGGGIVLQPFYRFGNNVQSKVGELSNNHIVSYHYENAMKYEKYGIDLMGTYFKQLKNKNQLYFTCSIQKFWESAQYKSNRHSITDWEVSSQLAYILPKYDALFAAVLQKSNVKNITAQGYSNNANDFLALSLRKGIFKSKVSLGCTYITPFDSFATTHVGNIESGTGFDRSKLEDVSIVQNTFIFQIVFNLNKNEASKISKSQKKSIDKDKVQTGLL